MPIRFPEPPAGAVTVVAGELAVLAGLGSRSQLQSMAAPGATSLTAPHGVYRLDLDDVRSGTIDAARLEGWRYLVEVDGRVVAAAQLLPAGDRMVHVNEGQFVQATVAAMAVADDAVGAAAGDVELRLLHVPSMHFMGLWLHGQDGDERVVPMTPAASEFDVGRAYPAAELLSALAAAPAG